ncbi:MAG: HAMP domain-containing histidine kinase [Ruminococcus sp.]|nr:HAMP domain-containing histidine kinase [Ruminococcus sp.]
MKKKLLTAAAAFALLLVCTAVLLSSVLKGSDSSDKSGEQIVALNEIEQLYKSGETEKAEEKAEELAAALRSGSSEKNIGTEVLVISGVSLLFMGGVLAYVYFSVLRPFDKLKGFAGEIAMGNFDVSLEYDRANYFGTFTWAFDSMRREITKSRACEREAIENNKTVIATLSHDIKTPIASLRAYAEGLEANMDTTPEKRARYLSVITRKCDEVARLTNDLFLHSLSSLDKLSVAGEDFELGEFISDTLEELSAERGDIRFVGAGEPLPVTADKKRITQLLENLVNNSRKYAGTKITAALAKDGDEAVLTVSDRGPGIPDEDIPFIFGKFYRGHNCGNEQGSGLGLYIVKYIAEKHGGSVSLRNLPEGGLEVTVRMALRKT